MVKEMESYGCALGNLYVIFGPSLLKSVQHEPRGATLSWLAVVVTGPVVSQRHWSPSQRYLR